MLVLTGQGPPDRLHKESHQVMDVVQMFRPVTKWAHQIINANNIPEVVRKAARLTRTEKPGAVLLELPEDIAEHETTAEPIKPRRFRRPVPDDKVMDRAFAVKDAKRPVILAGNGAIRKRASKQLRQLCETTGIGVASTFMAKGCVDMDAEYCLYTVGLQAKDFISRAIDEADVVLTLGYDMVEYHPRLWNDRADKRIIHVDFLPSEIDDHYYPEVEVVGDIAHTLWMLNERFAKEGVPAYDLAGQRSSPGRYERARGQGRRHGRRHRPRKSLGRPPGAGPGGRAALRRGRSQDVDRSRRYHCHEPNTCLIPNGFCSMGFALPGARGGVVHPDKRPWDLRGCRFPL